VDWHRQEDEGARIYNRAVNDLDMGGDKLALDPLPHGILDRRGIVPSPKGRWRWGSSAEEIFGFRLSPPHPRGEFCGSANHDSPLKAGTPTMVTSQEAQFIDRLTVLRAGTNRPQEKAMKIVIIGATGTIGKAVVKALSTRHDIVPVSHSKGTPPCGPRFKGVN
jgi:hypothetical protein